ncbi:hypothetical protein F5X68DRAFT_257437 [Plectosphaerella plurivora]|uniref:Uncharacterized protein n=1 Tax=Plectosphaerella plurivora TaxID=936078 RepID=A0A9P8VMJ4_9PEZI|nr:hypothetical protein F5X68DRAFT_257437 [Plectosphaerella plurivora]
MATRNLGTEMLWHFYYSPDGSRLPYPTPDQETEKEETQIDLKALTHARHIVGWCSKAKFHAGAPDMNYNIKPTRLKRPSKDFSLEKLSVSVGSIVTAGCQFAIGEKDSHVRIGRIRYGSKLSWIHRKYVTLWDVDEKRGWLVKGTAALLHLLRASLHFNRTDEVQCGFLLDEDQPKDSSRPLTLNSSLDVLQDESNLELEIFPPEDKTKADSTPFRLKARVEKLYEMLEMLIDHQASAEASYKGLDAKLRFRDHLEGWDFADIATDLPPFKLKQTTVPAQMRSWVDFTRSIPAITLFGRGFGDIIRATPAGTGNSRNPAVHSCSEWETVPKNRHLLCVSAADLGKILARTGDDSTCPVTLGDGIVWHNPQDEDPFQATCSCTSGQHSKRNHHPVQEVRSSLERFKMSKSTIDLEAHPYGAVIFGEKKSWLAGLTTSSSDTTSQGTMLGHSSTSAQSDGGDANSSSFEIYPRWITFAV